MEDLRSRTDYRPVVIRNPNSTNNNLTDAIVDELTNDLRWGAPDVILTQSADPIDNAHDIATQLDSYGASVVLVCGGDGLMMSAANAVNLSPGLRETVRLMPLPVGNACDTSRSFYGGNVLSGAMYLDLMAEGEAHPLSCIETVVDGHSRLSVAYSGFQTTAAISRLFADPQWRDGRPDIKLWPPALKRFIDHRLADIRDTKAMFQTLTTHPPFTYEESVSTDPDRPAQIVRRESHDILYNNVPLYARLGRVATNVRSGSIMIEFPAGTFRRQLVQAVGQALTSGMRGIPTEERQIVIASEDVWMHNDGECIELEKGSQVTMRDKAAAITAILPWQL